MSADPRPALRYEPAESTCTIPKSWDLGLLRPLGLSVNPVDPTATARPVSDWAAAAGKKHAVSKAFRKSLDASRSYVHHLRPSPSLSRDWTTTTWTSPEVKHRGETPQHLLALSLTDSLYGLERVRDEARVEKLPVPSASVVDNARSLLPRLHRIRPGFYDVYPTEQGAVAITPPPREGASASIECHDKDIVYCFASIDGNSRRAKFYQMDDLPDPFIEKVLRDLGR